MADPAVQAFFLSGLKIFVGVAAIVIALGLAVRLYDRITWSNYAARRAAERRQTKQDENWHLRHQD
jgi:multisubunit Na+/H+ antiporter MnhC subunit